MLHDTKTGAHWRRVLWEQDTLKVFSWDMCSMTSLEGQCVVYVWLRGDSSFSGPVWCVYTVFLIRARAFAWMLFS